MTITREEAINILDDFDEIDTDIEVIAWQPLPTPYEPQEGSDKE